MIPAEAEEAERGEADDGLEVLDAKPRHDVFKPGDDEKKWDGLIQRQDDVKVRQLTFVEVVPSRHSKHVVPAIGKNYTKLRYMGLPVLRVHSDRARELTSAAMHKWAGDRNVFRTYTDGDSWKLNGRAEAEIGVLSRSAKTLLADCELEARFWPLAVRHAAERRLRGQLQALRLPVKDLLPFGSFAYAKMKEWTDRGSWKTERVKVQIMGPDMTINSGGYFVRDTEGRFFHTTDVRTVEVAGDVKEDSPDVEVGWIQPGGKRPEDVPLEPSRRVVGKTPMSAVKRLEVISVEMKKMCFEEERWNGLALIAEESEIREKFEPQEGGWPVDLLDPIIEQNQILEARIKALAAEGDDLVKTECLDAAEWLQTVTIPLSGVRKELEAWRPAALKEYEALMANGAVRKARDREVEQLEKQCKEQGRIFELVPGKAVCTRKAPDGRRKVRGVVRGNFACRSGQHRSFTLQEWMWRPFEASFVTVHFKGISWRR